MHIRICNYASQQGGVDQERPQVRLPFCPWRDTTPTLRSGIWRRQPPGGREAGESERPLLGEARGGHRGAGPLRMWACVPSGLGCSAPPFPAVLAVPTWHARPPWWGHRILAARSTRLPHDLLPIRCPFSVDTVHRSTSSRTSRPSTRQAYPDSRRDASIQGRWSTVVVAARIELLLFFF